MKNGFTLAEILITLGVIGVISAMTIPTVINKYKERETVSKVKKFYSTMNQAFLLSVKDNGYANEWNVGNGAYSPNAVKIASYLKPYLKILRDCGTSSDCLGYTESVNLLNGKKHGNYNTSSGYYKIILSDGSYIWWRASTGTWCQETDGININVCAFIWIDINGNKQPNTIGKDIFNIAVTPYSVKPNLFDDCYKNNNGWGCLNYILQNDNMNYLH